MTANVQIKLKLSWNKVDICFKQSSTTQCFVCCNCIPTLVQLNFETVVHLYFNFVSTWFRLHLNFSSTMVVEASKVKNNLKHDSQCWNNAKQGADVLNLISKVLQLQILFIQLYFYPIWILLQLSVNMI